MRWRPGAESCPIPNAGVPQAPAKRMRQRQGANFLLPFQRRRSILTSALKGAGMGSYNDTKYSCYVEAQIGSGPSVKEEPKWALNADWCVHLCQLQGRVTTRGLAD
jgi:hypothetical protein